jgi:hypothetical protein
MYNPRLNYLAGSGYHKPLVAATKAQLTFRLQHTDRRRMGESLQPVIPKAGKACPEHLLQYVATSH